MLQNDVGLSDGLSQYLPPLVCPEGHLPSLLQGVTHQCIATGKLQCSLEGGRREDIIGNGGNGATSLNLYCELRCSLKQMSDSVNVRDIDKGNEHAVHLDVGRVVANDINHHFSATTKLPG